MNITNLLPNSHLTPTDKRHIVALIESGKTQAKINRAIWVIIQGNGDGEYTLRKQVNDRGLGFIGEELRQSTYTFKIKVKR